MKRLVLLLAFVILSAVIAQISYATVFQWPGRVRPPVSLSEALEMSETLLGDDAKNRFCIQVFLYGSATDDRNSGTWSLLFGAEDGSKKHIYVDMDRQTRISTWNEAIDWTKNAGRRRDLQDVKTRLESLFAKEKLDLTIELQGGRLTGGFRTRDYELYETENDGSFSMTLTKKTGPQHDGFSFDAEIVDEGADRSYFSEGPYWTEYTQSYPTAERGKMILVRKQCGRELKQELHRQIDQVFGIDYENP